MEEKNLNDEPIQLDESYDANGRKRILSIKDLEVEFHVRGRKLTAIRGVNLDIYDGESIAIVGESGSGKSVLTKTFSGMLDSNGHVSAGSITYYDETLSATKAYKTPANNKLYNLFLNKLNDYSKYEFGKDIFNEIEAINKRISDERGVSEDFVEVHSKKIEDLDFELTELFNHKQTLNKANNAEEIEQINKRMAELKDEKKKALEEFKQTVKETREAYDNDAEKVAADKAKLAELDEAYKKAIDVQITKEQIERNACIAKDLVLSVARYPFSKKVSAIRGIFKCFKRAMQKGIELTDEVLDNLYSDYAFRVKYLYEREYPLNADGSINTEVLDIFYKLNSLSRFEEFSDTYKQVKEAENKLYSIEDQKSEEYANAEAEYKKISAEYGSLGGLYNLSDEQLERNEFVARAVQNSLSDLNPEEKKEALKTIMSRLEEMMRNGEPIDSREKAEELMSGIVPFKDYQIPEGTQPLLHNNGKKCKPFWFGSCKNSLQKFKLNSDWQQIRGKRVATIFQDPMTSLNPIITIGKQITDCILKHQDLTLNEAEAKAKKLMELVGIHNPDKRFYDYPFQYSGGMRQRIVIAIALSCEPKILICDEPTTALDVTIQAQIIRLIKDLQKKLGFTIVFITHDLGVVANVADRVAVLYAGQIVEIGNVEEVFYNPQHPYTWALLSSLPQLSTRGEELFSISGTPPSLYNKIKGDPFAPRNPYRMAVDFVQAPPLFKVSETHYAKTWLLDPRAPKADKPKIIEDIHGKLMNTVYSNANSLVDQEVEEKKVFAEEKAVPEEVEDQDAPKKKKSKKVQEEIVRLPNEAVANVETLSDAEFKAQYKERIAKDKEELKALLAKYSQEVSQEITAETKERNVRYAKTILLSSAIKGKNANQIATKAIKSLTDAAKHGSILDAEKLKSVISRNTSFCEAIDENGTISGTNEYNQEIRTALDANYNEFVAKASETEIEAKDSIKVSDVIAKYSEQLDIAAHFELGAETYQAIKKVKTDLNRVIPTNGPIDPSNGKEIICSLKNVDITFGKFKAVKDASFDIYKGETFSLVGESGSGKTTIGRAVIRINGVSNGVITYKGMKISGKISRKADREVVRNIQMVFQDPAASLNERATVEYIVGEGIDNFHLYDSKEERMQKIEGIIKKVGLLPEHLTRYPHEFSGGQRQRIGLARSIVMEPELVIADEPISALDVSIRAQVLNLLKKFQKDYGITYLFVAHDLSIVRFISDRIAVIYKGTIVEIAESEELFNFPLHPYTKSLLSAIPVPDPQIEKNKKLYVYDSDIHDYSRDKPSMRKITEGHFVYCNNKEFDEYKKIRG